ncbi:hypothetical protein F0U63_43255 [Cystobacter fuscus]|nr:hypothetical protein F0U63_43255 [Cystobacter fuscus]
MYCSSCRQERLGGQLCAACGKPMTARSREALEQELAHIRFLLGELPHWDTSSVPKGTRNYLTQRYERQVRILDLVLAETAPVAVPAPVQGAPVETAAPVVVPASIEAPQQVALSAEALAPPVAQPSPSLIVTGESPENPLLAATQASPAEALPAPKMSFSKPEPETFFSKPEEEEEEEEELAPLPPVVTEPLFDAPVRRSPTARLVEEVSTWDTVWRPFLYESIGWFIGAFLIVAGSLYLAFDSWAGLTSVSRSLVVFGMTAGYSAAFSICGALLARREALASAGRILGLIGAAVGPLAGLALGPLDSLSLDGIPLYLLLPLLVGWSVAAAALVRKPAESFDVPSRPLLQGALVGTTWMMGLAPLAARLGTSAVWFDLLPCVLFALLARQPVPAPRTSRALAFTLAAPSYLLLLYAVRLHVALAASGTPPALGSYAPFLAVLLATCPRFRPLPPEEAADSLSVGVASLQVGCLVLAATGSAPAFFLTAAISTWTVLELSRGSPHRVRWLYPTYAGAYLVYTSVDQVLPGALRAHLDWPWSLRTVTALPFVLAGTLLAGWLSSRAARTSSERDAASAEVLLRSTAIASPLLVLLGCVSLEFRLVFWSTLALMVLCVAAGERLERLYLSVVGAALSVFLSGSAFGLWSASGASMVCGGGALVFAALPLVCAPRARHVYNAAAGWLALSGFVDALQAGAHGGAVVGLALSGAAMLLVAWNLANPYLFAVAAFAAAAVVPKLASLVGSEWVPLALAVSALGLAFLGERGGRARLLGASGVAHAVLAFGWGLALGVPWFGVIILLSAAAVGVASRVLPWVRPLAVLLAAFALLPRVGPLDTWPWMTPTLSLCLFVPWSLGASVIAARQGRGASTVPSTVLAGLLSVVFPVLAAMSRGGSWTGGDVVLVALSALFTARSLHPSFSVAMASLWPLLYVAASFRAPVALGLAVLLSALGLLESHRAAFRYLAGGRRFALMASLCAMPFLILACVACHGAVVPFVLAGTALLPLVWTRANREPLFAALAPVFVLLFALVSRELLAWAAALPVVALGVVRAAEHLPGARRFLLGSTEEAAVRRLSLGMQVALTAVAAAVLLAWGAPPAVFATLVASLVLLPGPRPSVRVGLGVGLLLGCVPLHPVAIVLLLALGLLTHHAPVKLGAFLRAPPDEVLRPLSVVGALVLAVGTLLLGGPTPGAILVLAGVLGVGAFLLSRGWMLTLSVLALACASLGVTPEHPVARWYPGAELAFTGVALGAALLSALCQLGSVQRALMRAAARLSPGLGSTWSEPLWTAGAFALTVPLLRHLLEEGPGGLSPGGALLAGLTALVLMVTRERVMANVAVALLAGVLVAAVPPPWSPAVLSGTGLVLCMVGTWLDERDLDMGAALHHAGWVLSLVAVFGLRDLRHPGTAACFVAGLGSAWAVVYRRREREMVGWVATLVAVHALMAHVGAVLSTGRGPVLILPVFGALSALLAAVALQVAGERVRRHVGHGFALVALVEVLGSLVLVPGSMGALRESLLACGGLTVLFFALVRRAVREEDEGSAFLAQGALSLGYLSVRLHALASELGGTDSLVALGGGVVFSGLYVFAQREGAGLPAFRRPALWGAFLFPLAGLLTAPWHQPLYVAALLVGYAAHFAALAAHPSQRGVGSLVSAAAFNAALLLVWLGTGAGEPQYYAIPVGLSLLVLLRVFRDALEPDTRAKLRAFAITFVYVAGAWKPLMFQDSRAMLLCVLLCVVGVAVGVALRIRSYVYLGSAFLVTCVVANLARSGMRDHRMGAAFLSLLGVGVVGFMVLFTAKRAELLERYARVRALMDTWEG